MESWFRLEFEEFLLVEYRRRSHELLNSYSFQKFITADDQLGSIVGREPKDPVDHLRPHDSARRENSRTKECQKDEKTSAVLRAISKFVEQEQRHSRVKHEDHQ